MLAQIYRGQDCACSHGDVLFAVFQRNTAFREPLLYEHAALFVSRKPIPIVSNTDTVNVLEMYKFARRWKWPCNHYEVQLACEKRNQGGAPLSDETRTKIVTMAERIVRRTRVLYDCHASYMNCDWEMKRYKYVRPNPNDPDIADELHFTCAGLVEYCYEQAGEDIINDPPCLRNHEENTECTLSEVPLQRDRTTKELVHRLYPGYLAEAFAEDSYPLDFLELRRRGEKPEDFRKYSSAHLDE